MWVLGKYDDKDLSDHKWMVLKLNGHQDVNLDQVGDWKYVYTVQPDEFGVNIILKRMINNDLLLRCLIKMGNALSS